MSFLDPLWHEPPVIIVHAMAAMLALVLGAVQFARPKGSAGHRFLGRVWVGLLALVAVSSFWIHELRVWGGFSPIHLVSVFTLAMLAAALGAARRGDIDGHRSGMIMLYVFGLVLTGAFTFMPGRVMHSVLFGA